MLDRPRNRICPSLIFIARSKTLRQAGGLKKGNKPSTTSKSAQAASMALQRSGPSTGYFAAAPAGAAEDELPRMALKKSLPGSTTITSDLLRKAERYASRLR